MNEPFRCPLCKRAIKVTYRSIIWHTLNRWHNPLTAYTQAREDGMAMWLIAPIIVGGLCIGACLAVLLLYLANR